jgi:hypothetical protein
LLFLPSGRYFPLWLCLFPSATPVMISRPI